MDKLNTLSLGEKLVAGGGVLMLIASFLPWYKIDFGLEEFGLGSFTANGWESPGAIWSVLAVLVGLVMAAAVLAPKLGNVQLPALGQYTWGQAHLALGALVALFILLKLINESSSISYGFFLGIIAAAALAGGGYMMYTEEKTGRSSLRG
jgi:hypothetical protein